MTSIGKPDNQHVPELRFGGNQTTVNFPLVGGCGLPSHACIIIGITYVLGCHSLHNVLVAQVQCLLLACILLDLISFNYCLPLQFQHIVEFSIISRLLQPFRTTWYPYGCIVGNFGDLRSVLLRWGVF